MKIKLFFKANLFILIIFYGLFAVNSELFAGLPWISSKPNNDDPLPPDQAFPFIVELADNNTLIADWNIASGYYLYRDKMRFRLLEAPDGITLGAPELPPGDPKEDEFLGSVMVYHGAIQIRLPLKIVNKNQRKLSLKLEANFQGCAEGRLCYPPLTRTATVILPEFNPDQNKHTLISQTTATDAIPNSETDRIVSLLSNNNRLMTIFWFFGIGLLLAFTPCVFPMIPILSSIIVGQGKDLSTARAFLLSLVYVLGMAVTYTIAGVLAGLLGTNLQAFFQNPWIISAFSAIFIALALSMFGLYELQLPVYLQTHLTIISNHQKGGTFLGVAIMGLLSALIVGPCIAPPLAGALIYIGKTGDTILGGLALLSMSMGMGTPLLIIGTTEGRWLPRAGIWMDTIKTLFGVLLLLVALWMLERILPVALSLFLYGLLFIVCGVYLGAVDSINTASSSGFQRLWKGIGIVLLIQGALLLLGAAGGGDDPFQPLKHLSGAANYVNNENKTNFFQRITSTAFDQVLSTANGRQIIIDFYADWCIECKRMEKITFSDPSLRTLLNEMLLIQVDVTQNNDNDQLLLKRFELFGPPALLFLSADGKERRTARIIGFINAQQLRDHLMRVL